MGIYYAESGLQENIFHGQAHSLFHFTKLPYIIFTTTSKQTPIG